MKTSRKQPAPRRGRRKETVRIGPWDVPRPSADVILSVAEERGLYPYALIVEVVDRWARRYEQRRLRERTHGSKGQ